MSLIKRISVLSLVIGIGLNSCDLGTPTTIKKNKIDENKSFKTKLETPISPINSKNVPKITTSTPSVNSGEDVKLLVEVSSTQDATIVLEVKSSFGQIVYSTKSTCQISSLPPTPIIPTTTPPPPPPPGEGGTGGVCCAFFTKKEDLLSNRNKILNKWNLKVFKVKVEPPPIGELTTNCKKEVNWTTIDQDTQLPLIGGYYTVKVYLENDTTNFAEIPIEVFDNNHPNPTPTIAPTINPSIEPSINPSSNPSGEPNTNPSGNPNTNPSSNPNPSSSPTNTPTPTPTPDSCSSNNILLTKLDSGIEFLSPKNQDGIFDSLKFNISTSQCSKEWELSINGKTSTEESNEPSGACIYSVTGSGSSNIDWNGKCNDGSFMADGEYTATLKVGSTVKTTNISIDNTEPILEIDFDKSTVSADGTVNLVGKIFDPIVNGVHSDIDFNTLPDSLTSADGTKITLNLNSNGGAIASIPSGFNVASFRVKSSDTQAAIEEAGAKLVIAMATGKTKNGQKTQDKAGNSSSCYVK